MTDWPVTFRCNNNCISCILNTEVSVNKEDPPLRQVKDLIDAIESGSDYLGLSGGEPTLRKELFEILEYVKKRNPDLYVFLVSNGRMFSYRQFTEKLAKVRPKNFMVGIALYGHNPELHDSVTRAKGGFEQTIRGVKNLLDAGVRVEIRVVVNRLNYKHLEAIARFVMKELPSIDRMVFVNMKMTGNAFKNRGKVSVRISDVVPFAQKAVVALEKSGIETRLYHFPLCVIPRDLWPFAEGITKHDIGELVFTGVCNLCSIKDRCCKIWATYLVVFGGDEFKAIKQIT